MALQPAQNTMVSAAVARVVAKDAPYAERLAAARGETALSGRDLVTALYLLYYGADREIRAASVRTLQQSSAEALASVAALTDLPQRILHFLAQVRGTDPVVFRAFLNNPACASETLAFLLERVDRPLFSLIFDHEALWRDSPEAVDALLRNSKLTEEERSALAPEAEPVPLAEDIVANGEDAEGDRSLEDADADEEEWDEESDGESSLPDEENFSKYQLAIDMGVSEKIKMALTGDKEWRSIFLKDSNKLVNTAVLKNPRITDGEVIAVCKNKTSSEELIRLVLLNKEWVKLPPVRSALVTHPKTPIASALRFMPTLVEKELKNLSKSKSVSQVVVSAARRVLAEKVKKK